MRNMLNVLFLIDDEEHRITAVNPFPIKPVMPEIKEFSLLAMIDKRMWIF